MNKKERSAAKELGLTRYKTGKPCPRGHIAERYVSTGQCTICLLSFKKEWLEKSIDKQKEYSKEYHVKNRDTILVKNRQWRLDNKEKHTELCKDWKKRNPESRRIYMHKRRVLQKLNGGACTLKEIRRMRETQNHKCVYCEKDIKENFHIDHKTPLSKGGTNLIENIQILCPTCNMRKHTKTHEEFLTAQGE